MFAKKYCISDCYDFLDRFPPGIFDNSAQVIIIIN